jgi:hypothetical protein
MRCKMSAGKFEQNLLSSGETKIKVSLSNKLINVQKTLCRTVKPSEEMRSAFFWDITQRRMVTLYRRFGTMYRSHLQGLSPRILGLVDP